MMMEQCGKEMQKVEMETQDTYESTVGELKTDEAQHVLIDEVNSTELTLVKKEKTGKTKSRSADRHKTIECTVCFRKMRTDHLIRHMRTHQKIFTLKEDEMRNEIRRFKQVRDERENQERATQKIADEEGISPENCGINPTNTLPHHEISEKEEKESMCKDHHKHQSLIERGKRITDIMIAENISEGSLTRDRKYALDLYIRSLSRDTQIRAFYRREIPYMYRKNRKLKLQKEQFRF